MNDIILEGWLYKSPPRKRVKNVTSWKKRHFRLFNVSQRQYFNIQEASLKQDKSHESTSCKNVDNFCLGYWKSENRQEPPIRIISLHGCSIEDQKTHPYLNTKFKHTILLITETRKYYLSAEDKDSKMSWLTQIQKRIQEQNRRELPAESITSRHIKTCQAPIESHCLFIEESRRDSGYSESQSRSGSNTSSTSTNTPPTPPSYENIHWSKMHSITPLLIHYQHEKTHNKELPETPVSEYQELNNDHVIGRTYQPIQCSQNSLYKESTDNSFPDPYDYEHSGCTTESNTTIPQYAIPIRDRIYSEIIDKKIPENTRQLIYNDLTNQRIHGTSQTPRRTATSSYLPRYNHHEELTRAQSAQGRLIKAPSFSNINQPPLFITSVNSRPCKVTPESTIPIREHVYSEIANHRISENSTQCRDTIDQRIPEITRAAATVSFLPTNNHHEKLLSTNRYQHDRTTRISSIYNTVEPSLSCTSEREVFKNTIENGKFKITFPSDRQISMNSSKLIVYPKLNSSSTITSLITDAEISTVVYGQVEISYPITSTMQVNEDGLTILNHEEKFTVEIRKDCL